MHVRTAVPDDAEAIERARIHGWRIAYRHVFPPAELDRLPVEWSRWRQTLEHSEPGHTCLVCEIDGRVIGFATIGPSADHELGELHGLYVDPDSWSLGAGRALIEEAEARLASVYAVAVLWVLEANVRARQFYETAGWELDGMRGTFDRLGVRAPVVRYRKAFNSSTSRA